MFLQNYVHRYIAKIYTNTQAWWLHFWDKLFSLSIQVYAGLFEYSPQFRRIKGKLLDAHSCILSRLTTLVGKKSTNTHWTLSQGYHKVIRCEVNQGAQVVLATLLKQPCIWYCWTFNPFLEKKTSLMSIKAGETNGI